MCPAFQLRRSEIERYLAKSGDDYIAEGTLLENNHGFMIYRIFKGELCVMQAFGDGKYWDDKAVELARQNGCKTVKFGTKRKPGAFCRKYGYTVAGYILTKEV